MGHCRRCRDCGGRCCEIFKKVMNIRRHCAAAPLALPDVAFGHSEHGPMRCTRPLSGVKEN